MLLCKSGFMLLTAQGYFAPSQWETTLQSNAVSHWLGQSIVFNSQILVYLRCDMAFIEPRHCNKPNITYFRCILFTVLLFRSQSHCGFQAPALLVMWVPMLWQQFCLMWALKKRWNSMAIVVVCFKHISWTTIGKQFTTIRPSIVVVYITGKSFAHIGRNMQQDVLLYDRKSRWHEICA